MPADDHEHAHEDPRLAARAAWLTAAIRARRALHLLYNGSWRVVHPHAVGRTSRDKTVLLAWQTAGFGRSGEHEGWRMFDVARIDAVEELRATFTPRPRTPRRRGLDARHPPPDLGALTRRGARAVVHSGPSTRQPRRAACGQANTRAPGLRSALHAWQGARRSAS